MQTCVITLRNRNSSHVRYGDSGGEHGLADPDQLAGRNIIIATDGVKNGMSFDACLHFLDKIRIERTVGAIPVGPSEVIERLNQRLDEVHCCICRRASSR